MNLITIFNTAAYSMVDFPPPPKNQSPPFPKNQDLLPPIAKNQG